MEVDLNCYSPLTLLEIRGVKYVKQNILQEQTERVRMHLLKEKRLLARENIVQGTSGVWKSCFLERYIPLAPSEFSFGDVVKVIYQLYKDISFPSSQEIKQEGG